MSKVDSKEIIGMAADLTGIYGFVVDSVLTLSDWMSKDPNAPDPIFSALNTIHKKLDQIDDQNLAIWATKREEDITFLKAHATGALQTANAFEKSGAAASDPRWEAELGSADRDSLLAVNNFVGDLEGGFWLRPNSIKAISEIEDPTTAIGWMSYMDDRAEIHSFNRVWDHRWALPVTVYVIAARIAVIETLKFPDERIRSEVNRYKQFIDSVIKKMESGVRAKRQFTELDFKMIPHHGVPVFVVDIYGGYFIGSLCDPLFMTPRGYKGKIPEDTKLMPQSFHMIDNSLKAYSDARDKLNIHWTNLVKRMIGISELWKFSGNLDNMLLSIDKKGGDRILALKDINVDFSVDEKDLREWLNNPTHTPYPSISESLLKLLGSKRLRKPVFIDVIVFNYEETHGMPSPRRLEDVNFGILKKSIIDSYNNRYGEGVDDFQALVI